VVNGVFSGRERIQIAGFILGCSEEARAWVCSTMGSLRRERSINGRKQAARGGSARGVYRGTKRCAFDDAATTRFKSHFGLQIFFVN
jgi:hypothetical protein